MPGRMGSLLPIAFVLVTAGALGSSFVAGPPPLNVQDTSGSERVRAVASSMTVIGHASVVDGDTIEIHGERIRFNGIDAPESPQTCHDRDGKPYRCGASSAVALTKLLKTSSPTRCEFVERDRYGRFVGNCFRADGSSVQELIVRGGWAMDWPRYSDGAFSKQQQAAKRDGIGIWVGEFHRLGNGGLRAAWHRSRQPRSRRS